MKVFKIIFVFVVIIGMASLTFAQGRGQGKGRGQGQGRGMGQKQNDNNFVRPCYGTKNNLKLSNPIFITGKIVNIERVKFAKGLSDAIHITVKDEKGIRLIHMGPEFYFTKEKITFKPGDQFKGIVYKGEYNKESALFVANIDYKGKKISLRDKNGISQWRGSQGTGRGQGNGRGQGRENR